jgi:tetratricopeptide (TPR) repeat protein
METMKSPRDWFMLLLFSAALIAHGSARADKVDDCNGDNPAKVVTGCSAVIKKGHQSKANLEAAYVARAIAYDDLKDYDRAIADIDQAVKLDPKDANAFYNQGVINEHSEDLDSAIIAYTKSLALAPRDAETYLGRGNAYRSAEQPEMALADYQKALELDPKNMDVLYGRGLAYEALGKKDLAIDDLKKVSATSKDEVTSSDAQTEVEKLQKTP